MEQVKILVALVLVPWIFGLGPVCWYRMRTSFDTCDVSDLYMQSSIMEYFSFHSTFQHPGYNPVA
jgi:hypothetical protein